MPVDKEIHHIDLNLLVALDAFLEERSVTRTAKRLGVGQPAASHTLARLREVLQDPLFVRSSGKLVPTPYAERLREPVARLVHDARRIVTGTHRASAVTGLRRFTLICPDLLAPLLPRISARLNAAAPRVSLRVLPRAAQEARWLEEGEADLVLGPALHEGPGLRTRSLGTISFGIVAREGHPLLQGPDVPSLERWLSYPHAVVQSGSGTPNIIATHLNKAGLLRHVGLVVPSFLTALHSVAASDLLLSAPLELVLPLVRPLGLATANLPMAVPPLSVAALWHERSDHDEAHRLLRATVISEVERGLRLRRSRR